VKIFFDFEFIETGGEHPVKPISLGMIREDGKTFYAVWDKIPWDLANQWVLDNIKPMIEKDTETIPLPARAIAQEVFKFCGPFPEFWGYFCAFDWVLMCDLFEGFLKTPETWPHLAFDLRQYMFHTGVSRDDLDHIPNEQEHHALADAVWNRSVYKSINSWRLND
jgi:hypothetical protein